MKQTLSSPSCLWSWCFTTAVETLTKTDPKGNTASTSSIPKKQNAGRARFSVRAVSVPAPSPMDQVLWGTLRPSWRLETKTKFKKRNSTGTARPCIRTWPLSHTQSWCLPHGLSEPTNLSRSRRCQSAYNGFMIFSCEDGPL